LFGNGRDEHAPAVAAHQFGGTDGDGRHEHDYQ
jgi:hypothetical protein